MLAKRCSASERGIKSSVHIWPRSAFFRKMLRCIRWQRTQPLFWIRDRPRTGVAAAEAISGEALVEAFSALTEAVRRGGTALPAGGTLSPEHPVWVEFARAMSAPGAFLARLLAECLDKEASRPTKVLDIAAGHGLYGIEFAKRHSEAHVFAVDWPDVLAVARGNADAAGVASRFHSILGYALTVDLGTGYDLALITHFLPDLDSTTAMLKRIHSALVKDG